MSLEKGKISIAIVAGLLVCTIGFTFVLYKGKTMAFDDRSKGRPEISEQPLLPTLNHIDCSVEWKETDGFDSNHSATVRLSVVAIKDGFVYAQASPKDLALPELWEAAGKPLDLDDGGIDGGVKSYRVSMKPPVEIGPTSICTTMWIDATKANIYLTMPADDLKCVAPQQRNLRLGRSYSCDAKGIVELSKELE